MKEVTGNLWDFHKQGYWVVITTNGVTRSNGHAVMGRGVALQAKQRFPRLPLELGQHLDRNGNIPACFPHKRVITLPTKRHWREKSSLALIEESCRMLVEGTNALGIEKVYMVRPGCANGGLNWKDVKPVLEEYLDDRFTVVQLSEGE